VLTTKYPPKSPLYHLGSRDITRSKPHRVRVSIHRNSRATASALRRPRSRASCPGAGSRRSARTKAKHVRNSAAASTTVRPQKKGVLSQNSLTGMGVRTQPYRVARPAKRIRSRTKATGRNPAVVSAIRRTAGDQRASVSCIMPAMAGPVAARPDQNTTFTR
jgi:hypothetical protein